MPDTVDPRDAERPLVLAMDVGSSSIRAALYDRRARALDGTAVQVPYTWDVGPDGSIRCSHERLLGLVWDTFDAIESAAGALTGDVVAGGISCFIHSIVGLDAQGRPITAVLSWADTTSAAEAASLRGRMDPTWVHATTGAPIHAGYWPARIGRLCRESPDVRRWSGFPEVLAEALAGRPVVSRSMASGTGLLDRAKGAWSPDLLASLGLDEGRLPAIVADDDPLGPPTATLAERWPSLAHVRWFAPWGDGGCGNVGLGAEGTGAAALMVGTSGALRSVIPDPAPAVPVGLFAQRLGGGAVVGGQLSEGGGTLAWASTLLRRSRASLERAVAGMDADAHGLTVLPYAFGERGLGYHDGARGALVGLTADTDATAIYRAVLESIAFGFAAVDDQLAGVVGGRPAIVASGGALDRSPVLERILADSLGRDISVAPAVESSRRGAALLALRGSALIDDPSAIAAPMTRVVAYDAGRSARYREARARRDALYEAILG